VELSFASNVPLPLIASSTLSIIIPTLNTRADLSKTLLAEIANDEIVGLRL
jgi:hypothetical protein